MSDNMILTLEGKPHWPGMVHHPFDWLPNPLLEKVLENEIDSMMSLIVAKRENELGAFEPRDIELLSELIAREAPEAKE